MSYIHNMIKPAEVQIDIDALADVQSTTQVVTVYEDYRHDVASAEKNELIVQDLGAVVKESETDLTELENNDYNNIEENAKIDASEETNVDKNVALLGRRARNEIEMKARNKYKHSYIDQECNCKRKKCQIFGYRNTSVIDCVLKASKDVHGNEKLIPSEDKRGQHKPKNYIDRTPIKQHINLFNSKPSHCRRSHAPDRKYLPPDLSIKDM